MKKLIAERIFIVGLLLMLIASSTLVLGFESVEITNIQNNSIFLGSGYKGHLRIYIVEIKSRWDMDNGAPYKYAFYDFAFDDTIEIPYLETHEDTITWQGDVEEDNVMILAAIFNPEEHRNYADPPLGRPFDAHYVDAAAGVKPGETESNVKNEDFTHTVFCEIGTASWCPSCPDLAREVVSVYESGDYPFYFVELVTDKSNLANSRTNDFNLKWLPTAFYDGGFEVVVGGGYGASHHKNQIEKSGARDVHDLDFTLGSEWIGDGTIDISISITNNEELPNSPPEKPTINGPEEGKPGEVKEFEISTTDPDEDDVFYMIDWGDDEVTDWLGPYASGETITAEHEWAAEGNYIIKVKAKDPDGAETEWSWLRITMPKTYQFSFFEWIISHFPFVNWLPF